MAAQRRGEAIERPGWLLPLVQLLAIGSLAACTVTRFMEGERGTDLSRVTVGAGQQEIEAIVGTPVREWQSAPGIRYRLYSYDEGAPPRSGDAATMVYLDVVSIGLAEVFVAADNARGGHAYKPFHVRSFLAVAYGDDDRAVGIFAGVNEFAVLPDDGRPTGDATGKAKRVP
jgi:hypothetical protein